MFLPVCSDSTCSLTVPAPAVPGCIRRSPGGRACWLHPSRSIRCSPCRCVPQNQSHTTERPATVTANTTHATQSAISDPNCCSLRFFSWRVTISVFIGGNDVTPVVRDAQFGKCRSSQMSAHCISRDGSTGPITVGPLEENLCARGDSICHLSRKSAQSITSCQTTKGAATPPNSPASWIMKSLSCIWATVNDRLVNLVLRWLPFSSAIYPVKGSCPSVRPSVSKVWKSAGNNCNNRNVPLR